MAAQAGHPALGVRPISLRSRIYGLGSVYAKTMRDSRLAFIVGAGLMGGIMLAVSAAITKAYPTADSRTELASLATSLGGAAQGIAGKAVNVGTMGGYVQWKYGPIFLWIVAIWSILALSSTLAAEAHGGSLEFVAAAPFGKRRIALEKVAAHLTVLTLSVAILGLAAWLAGTAFAILPGDGIPVQAAVGFALWVGLVGLFFGGLAFALAQFFGRAFGAGVASAAFFAGWILQGYAATVPAFTPLAVLTPWAWTADHLPLAGQYYWPSLVPTAIGAAALLVVGVEAFARRDVGAQQAVRTPSLPRPLRGLQGPIERSIGERLPLTLAWSLGLGLFILAMAAISKGLADDVAKSPDLLKTFGQIFPANSLTTAAGFMQLMIQLTYIVVGFAAATLVAGWASDETSGRLEMLLSTPLARSRWAILSGLGVYAAIVVMTAIMAICVYLGAASSGSDALTPMAGTVVLGLYAAALAGVGFAVGGWRTSIAAEIVALIVVVTYLIDLLAPALSLPDWFHQIALTSHLGQPMIGSWDPVGVAACLVLAAGGLLIGGWGIARRDVTR
jgi:polyether ionophore transport system permease protein